MSREGGFSLLETLLATALMAGLSLIALQSVRQMGKSSNSWRAHSGWLQQQAAAEAFMRARLRDLANTQFAGPTGSKVAFAGTRDRLDFVAGAGSAFEAPGLYHYTFQNCASGQATALCVCMTPRLDGGWPKTCEALPGNILAPGPVTVGFSYWVADANKPGGGEWVDQWERGGLPARIRIRFAPISGPARPDLIVVPAAGSASR